jgi:protein tyrosine/serine phosphatase
MKRIFRLSLTAILGFFIALAIVRISGCTPDPILSQTASVSGGYVPAETSVVDSQFNFHTATPLLWRSAQPSEEALVRMKKHGLKTVINLRRDESNDSWEKAVAEKIGLGYYYFPMEAQDEHDLEKIDQILAVIQDPANQPALIHCAGGKDRTGLIAAIYKIQYTDQKFEDVHKEMLMLGYHQDRYPAVLRTIRRWCEAHKRPDIAEKISPDGRTVVES